MGEIVRHTSSLKPVLRNENKFQRFTFCAQEVKENGELKDLYNWVYLDEKWFKITEANTWYYLGNDETHVMRLES